MWARLNRNPVPDARGRVFPITATSGTYEIEDMNDSYVGSLYEGKAHCGQDLRARGLWMCGLLHQITHLDRALSIVLLAWVARSNANFMQLIAARGRYC